MNTKDQAWMELMRISWKDRATFAFRPTKNFLFHVQHWLLKPENFRRARKAVLALPNTGTGTWREILTEVGLSEEWSPVKEKDLLCNG